jgi:DUF3060 family protein
MRSSLLVVGFVVALSLSVAPSSPAGDAELAWIGQIPGLKPALQRGGPTGEAIYEVKGDPAVVFDKLHAGFVRNGWTIEKFRNTGLAGLALRTVVAVKDGTRAKAILAAGEGGSLIVNFAPAEGAARGSTSSSTDTINVIRASAPPPASSAPDTAAAPVRPRAPAAGAARPAGPRLEINQSRTTGVWACEDTDVVVRGTGSEITLEGNCGEVVVHGIGNRIDIRGRVFNVETHGRDNVVKWSAAANATPPRQRVFGAGNAINRVE